MEITQSVKMFSPTNNQGIMGRRYLFFGGAISREV
jgi:hypothetical protein